MSYTALNMVRDINGFNTFGLPNSLNKKSTILSANVEQHFTCPTNCVQWLAVFSFQPGAKVWFSSSDIATIPGGSFADTFSELNPSARLIFAGDVLSFITDDTTAEVGVILYAIPQ